VLHLKFARDVEVVGPSFQTGVDDRRVRLDERSRAVEDDVDVAAGLQAVDPGNRYSKYHERPGVTDPL